MKRAMRLAMAVVGIFVGGMNAMGQSPAESTPKYWVYIGTYTDGSSKGIYVAEFDAETGKLGEPSLAAESKNPSFLALHPSGKFLYAVGEVGDYNGRSTGFVSSFEIDSKTGNLTALNTKSSGGRAPCHLVVDARGRALLVANYTEGNVASLAIESNGRLGALLSSFQHVGSSVDDRRQQAPHAHSINLDAANEFAFAADLGIDKVVVYRYEADTGELTDVGAPRSAVLPPGSGPRHFAFHPSGDYAYVINELRSTIEVFRYEPKTGELRSLQNVSTLPDGYSQTNYTAEVVVHPSGKYVYGSNRGHDSIAVFQMNQQSGELTRVQVESTQGKTPRNFVVDPTGNWLLAENQGSDTIVVFAIDAVTGKLTPTGQIVSVPVPVCIRFLSQAK